MKIEKKNEKRILCKGTPKIDLCKINHFKFICHLLFYYSSILLLNIFDICISLIDGFRGIRQPILSGSAYLSRALSELIIALIFPLFVYPKTKSPENICWAPFRGTLFLLTLNSNIFFPAYF